MVRLGDKYLYLMLSRWSILSILSDVALLSKAVCGLCVASMPFAYGLERLRGCIPGVPEATTLRLSEDVSLFSNHPLNFCF